MLTHTPVDACRVHKISDVPALLLDGLKGFLHLLLLGDVTAESQVVHWTGRQVWGWDEADTSCNHAKNQIYIIQGLKWVTHARAHVPPGSDAAVALAAASSLESTASLQPLSASRRDTAFPMPREPPHTTAKRDMTLQRGEDTDNCVRSPAGLNHCHCDQRAKPDPTAQLSAWKWCWWCTAHSIFMAKNTLLKHIPLFVEKFIFFYFVHIKANVCSDPNIVRIKQFRLLLGAKKYFYCIGSSWDTTQAKLKYTYRGCSKVNVTQNIAASW